MKESVFQKKLKDELRKRFPGCFVLKTDPNDIQGFPDLLILFGAMWASLEVKKDKKAPKQPNQKYYVKTLNEMGFASFVYPQNKDDVLKALENYFLKS